MQLHRACAAGLAHASDEHRPAELAALYGERAQAAAPAAERRALLRTVQARAAKLVRARETLLAAAQRASAPAAETAACAPDACAPDAGAPDAGGAASLANIMAAWSLEYAAGEEASSQDAWTPWSSPWRGLERDDGRGCAEEQAAVET